MHAPIATRWPWFLPILPVLPILLAYAYQCTPFVSTPASADAYEETSEDFVGRALRLIDEQFVDSSDARELRIDAVRALVDGLGDPHSRLYTPGEYDDFRASTGQGFGGIGAQIGSIANRLTVAGILPDSPSEGAGLRVGDEILMIDGTPSTAWSAEDAVAAIRGEIGDTVSLLVLGDDAEPETVRIERGSVQVRPITASHLFPAGVGYVRLSGFGPTTTVDLRALLGEMAEDGMTSLVIDVRENPGGYLHEAISSANLFLDANTLVAATRGRGGREETGMRAALPAAYPDLPLAILVGPRTASAAEILAGALQDHDRAVVLGRTTTGKGSVQQVFRMPGGYHLKLTTMRWLTPAGRSLDATGDEAPADYHTSNRRPLPNGDGGVTPDREVVDSIPDLRAFLDRVPSGTNVSDAIFMAARAYTRAYPDLAPGFTLRDGDVAPLIHALAPQAKETAAEVPATVRAWLSSRMAERVYQLRWSANVGAEHLSAQDVALARARSLLAGESSHCEAGGLYQSTLANPETGRVCR